jgi:hypothetical protein
LILTVKLSKTLKWINPLILLVLSFIQRSTAPDDVHCIIHTHTADGMAVSAQKQGLLPLTQHALKFYDNLGYHTYEGIALSLSERARLVDDWFL